MFRQWLLTITYTCQYMNSDIYKTKQLCDKKNFIEQTVNLPDILVVVQ